MGLGLLGSTMPPYALRSGEPVACVCIGPQARQVRSLSGMSCSTTPRTAASVVPTHGMLMWADGDASPRTIQLVPVDDSTLEGEERFRVRLNDAGGGAGLGFSEIEVTIEDDEALRSLQFAEAVLQVKEGEPLHVAVTPLAASRTIVARYAVAPKILIRMMAHQGLLPPLQAIQASANFGGAAATLLLARFNWVTRTRTDGGS